MPIDLLSYNPMYVATPASRQSKYVVTSDEWNSLWQLSAMQNNNTAATMAALLTKLANELWSVNGAASIKNPAISGSSGTTVASQLTWLDSYVDTVNTLATNASITANNASTKADNNLVAANAYTDARIAELGEGIEFIPSIRKFTYDIQATGEGQVRFNIPDANFDSTKDILFVHQNGIPLLDSEYVVTNRVGTTMGYITLNTGVTNGTYITIQLIRVTLTVQ